MKVLLIGDTHGSQRNLLLIVDHAKRHLKEFDCILQLGDFGVWPKGNFLGGAAEIAQRFSLPLYFIAGNHDDYDQIDAWLKDPSLESKEGPWLTVKDGLHFLPRGSRWQWGGRTFGALGGAVSVDVDWRLRKMKYGGSKLWWPQETLEPRDIVKLGPLPLDVLVGHDTGYRTVPLGHWKVASWQVSPALQLRQMINSYLTQLALDTTRPMWYFHGHWHVLNLQLDELKNGIVMRVVGLDTLDTDQPEITHVYAVYDTATQKVTSANEKVQIRLDALWELNGQGIEEVNSGEDSGRADERGDGH